MYVTRWMIDVRCAPPGRGCSPRDRTVPDIQKRWLREPDYLNWTTPGLVAWCLSMNRPWPSPAGGGFVVQGSVSSVRTVAETVLPSTVASQVYRRLSHNSCISRNTNKITIY